MNLPLKLLLAFGAVLLFSLGVACAGLWLNHQALGAFQRNVQHDVANERAVSAMQSHFKTQVQEWKDVLLRGSDRAMFDKHWQAFQAQERWVDEHAGQLEPLLEDPEQHQLLSRFVAAHRDMARDYRVGLEKFQTAGLEPSVGDMAVRGMDRAPAKLLEELAQRIGQASAADAQDAYALGTRAARWSIALLLLAAAGGQAIAWTLSRSIARPIRHAIDVAERVSEGDLQQQIIAKGRDEAAQLLRTLADMQQRLRQMVSHVRGGAESVATASTQIAHGNSDLSQRTEKQASALQETAATMEQMGATVRHNTENAQQADHLARQASTVAEQGGTVVAQVVDTMNSISDSSRRIAEITGVIDGIAFQTNILALNAAVEAARAGEQGRGFAVVAAEVRTLAQRSAEAAKEIKALIGESAVRVEHGNALAHQAGNTMSEVVQAIRRVSTIVGEISSAAGEQHTGIRQIGTAISQMDSVTQQNAALVEESAAAAESLRGQARALVETVAVFRLEIA